MFYDLAVGDVYQLFESHQSGIEIMLTPFYQDELVRFESHQSGIEIKLSTAEHIHKALV